MDLTNVQWQTAIRHTTAVNSPGAGPRVAPNVVALTLATLVGDIDQITSSHTEYKWDAPTIWRTWAFTPSALAHVEAEFEPESYDAIEDRQRRQPRSFNKPVEPISITARLLPLRTVTSFVLTRIYHHSGTGPVGDYFVDFAALEMTIGFGQSSETIGIATMFDDQVKRERWAGFVADARGAAANGGTAV
ncbi:Uncharacterised protein [Mycobacteroides abscessus subsp. abscessus]|uniref:hypothetical protein n=1 Tax=Mycobacteroides abscessus TaxID=36809 RepID=UPI000925C793|nr:hypothetical protein [Mycobacteroides abscessus]SHV40778.1 Uncharacterised protein [Mycobacteroides abscessus subsp. abscessus]SHX02453.1 Uncharacterised protein [Mycobacteroides abscessus subsp. abscessus]SHX48662.1 Uncharacterised protein [Mycobacteroides abscessus subsp. abscessus]SHZ44939.1 Uncharacterised protein [Mycobacteroides abscessus subsp. abscessus]SHZ48107.1 Uncharacterised protein [Mycobacteroides abscessus subsp. abscessus]